MGFIIRLTGLPELPDDGQPAIGQDTCGVRVRSTVRADLLPKGCSPGRLFARGKGELLGDTTELPVAAAPEADFLSMAAACSAGLSQYLTWPRVRQILQRTCQRVRCKSGKVEQKTSYALTSLSRKWARSPQLKALWRGQWTIENQEHYVRDETLREDRCQIRVGNAPQALAALKNGILAALRYQGWTHIGAAIRYDAASVQETFAFLTQNAT